VDRAKAGLDDIFCDALERTSPAERAAYLDRVCGDDAELRRRVERLLEAHAAADNFLAAPPPVAAASGTGPAEGPGTVLGPYKLLEQIGEGGFGVVFLAEQTQPVRRKVALKVLKPGMDTRRVVARFEAERQALTLMDHPNIARVLDAGEAASGRPYFVMELVRGVPVTDFCDQNHLDIRARLGLVADVCQAVQHAHQKGVIHRDLKPSNILVTLYDGVPVVKVIDFGIAKAIGQSLTDKTLFTGFAQLIGTPLYMSPEQAELSGLDVDTRSDIYSLGVLLYELLSGTTPFDGERLRALGYDELRRVIREEEPVKPSTRVSTLGAAAATVAANRGSDPKRLSRLFRGELDWVVMKCLEKDRNRRYETAAALAADVRHYLHDEPVLACPPAAVYRLQKFARRNQRALLMLALLGVMLLTSLVALTVGLVAADRERQRAERAYQEEARRRHQAREVLDRMTSLLVEDHLAKQPALTEEHKAFLRQALEAYEEFAAETGSDEASRHGVAGAYRNVGRIRRRLGQAPGAEALFRQAAERYADLAADFPANPLYRQELAACHSDRGNALADTSRVQESLAAYAEARAVLKQLVAEFPAVGSYRRELARTHHNRGNALAQLGRLPEAEDACREAVALGQQLKREFPKVAEYREGLARAHANLSTILAALGRADESEAALRDALALFRELAADFPTLPSYRHLLAQTHLNLANRLRNAGRTDGVEAAYRDAVAVFRQLAADFPSVPKYRQDLATDLMNLGAVFKDSRRYAESAAAYDEALGLARRLVADHPAEPDYRNRLGTLHFNRGLLLAATDRFPEAKRAYADALAEREQLVAAFPANGGYHHNLASTLVNLAELRRAQGDFAGARDLLERAVPHHDAALKPSPRNPTSPEASRARGTT
jgi:eukaryotic-like serine/threonine-protein kinase